MNKARFLPTPLLGALFVCVAAAADPTGPAMLRSKPAQLRLTYEVLDLGATEKGDSETMGLAGAHYLVNLHPDWYVGVSSFGALQGERGGFFTGGFTLGTAGGLPGNGRPMPDCSSAAAVAARRRRGAG